MRVERAIWGALLFSIFFYIVMAFMVAQRNAGQPFAAALHHPMVLPLYAIGAATFGIAIFVRNWFRDRGQPRRKYKIVGWALFEAITVYGLVLAFIAVDWRLIVPPAALTILGFGATFPRD